MKALAARLVTEMLDGRFDYMDEAEVREKAAAHFAQLIEDSMNTRKERG